MTDRSVPWRNVDDDPPDWHDVGKQVELRRDGHIINGELTAEESTGEVEAAICYVSGQSIYNFDEWRETEAS